MSMVRRSWMALGLSVVILGTASTQSLARVRILIRPWWPRALVVAPVPPRHVVVEQPQPEVQKGRVDINVRPSDAEVYVDGKYRGVAASFSGYPQYLDLGIGSHSITFKKNGFKSEHITVYATAGQLFELDIALDRLGSDEVKPETSYKLDLEKTGRLALRVEPADAIVYIDDEFYGTVTQFSETEAAVVLRAGEHTIQVARPGYKTYTTKIKIEKDVVKEIHMSLQKAPEGKQ
ncbi:MAG: PEGA domain-containing protein [Kiritimatiellia bacterium]|nr:PEGA domain-containing protein [Kiritimatiellia bacterium]MDP6848284.1 PEGA domain-containing protein [Kiritimatiellia bacterium]